MNKLIENQNLIELLQELDQITDRNRTLNNIIVIINKHASPRDKQIAKHIFRTAIAQLKVDENRVQKALHQQLL